ncbi:MAG: BlaI/MecI/CopY family transcriptional regulator [Sedimentisphaerales bacterium]|nr:BlaI/MecI/CopY family transcriptional regulator [Sedimentisphaerales bacterium]
MGISNELTESEWTILEVVWDQQPCTAPDVQEILKKQTGWAYSTVKTIMDRMVIKGLLKTERLRNLILYRSVITRRQAQSGELARTVQRAFNGAFSPLVEFLLDQNKLSKKELEHLEQMIRQKRDRT